MTPSQHFMAQRLRRTEADFASAAQRVSRVTDLALLRNAGHVSVPVELRAAVRSLPGHRRLQSALTLRAEQLVDRDLKALDALTPADGQSPEDFVIQVRQEFGKMRDMRWHHLRGDFSQVLHQACRRAEEIIARAHRAAKAQ